MEEQEMVQEQEQKFTLEEALRIVIGDLSSVSFPGSVLAEMTSDGIISVKQTVINPVEQARRNLIEILMAYEEGKRAALEAQAQEEEKEVSEDEANPE